MLERTFRMYALSLAGGALLLGGATVAAGAMTGITSVLLVMMLSQPRIMLALARDGLVPKGFFGAIHPTFRTPLQNGGW